MVREEKSPGPVSEARKERAARQNEQLERGRGRVEERGGPCSWTLLSFRRTFRQRCDDELITDARARWALGQFVEIRKLLPSKSGSTLSLSRRDIRLSNVGLVSKEKKKRIRLFISYLRPGCATSPPPLPRQRSILCQVTMDFEK